MADPMNLTRKSKSAIRVYCLPEERKLIQTNAKASGLSVAAYLRNVGMGYQIRGIIDHTEVERLAKINGDLGRLGGLLKLWLTDDIRTAHYGESVIRAVLDRILATQAQMLEIMKLVVMPKAKR